jgi:hypothetical protein
MYGFGMCGKLVRRWFWWCMMLYVLWNVVSVLSGFLFSNLQCRERCFPYGTPHPYINTPAPLARHRSRATYRPLFGELTTGELNTDREPNRELHHRSGEITGLESYRPAWYILGGLSRTTACHPGSRAPATRWDGSRFQPEASQVRTSSPEWTAGVYSGRRRVRTSVGVIAPPLHQDSHWIAYKRLHDCHGGCRYARATSAGPCECGCQPAALTDHPRAALPSRLPEPSEPSLSLSIHPSSPALVLFRWTSFPPSQFTSPPPPSSLASAPFVPVRSFSMN